MNLYPAVDLGGFRPVISHSDQDHYKGFSGLFKSTQFKFDSIYHNGIVERAGTPLLEPRVTHGGRDYLADCITTHVALQQFLGIAQNVGTRQYPKMLKEALDSGRVTEIRGLAVSDGHMPGFATGPLNIQVLGPVPETVNGQPASRWLHPEKLGCSMPADSNSYIRGARQYFRRVRRRTLRALDYFVEQRLARWWARKHGRRRPAWSLVSGGALWRQHGLERWDLPAGFRPADARRAR